VIEHVTTSEAGTTALGRDLGRTLRAGDTVLLVGPLGAGKTAFARGVAEGAGCDPEEVSSPTFTLVQEYPGPVTVQHVDLYRLSPAEVDELVLEDLWEGGVLVVEWPERWVRQPSDAIVVELIPEGDTARRIRIRGSAATRTPEPSRRSGAP
jgi:tRNA threonylcarbamoyl adenosine modification protein YjeE